MEMNNSGEKYDLITTLQYVGSSINRTEALRRYTEKKDFLNKWRFIYADESQNGPFKLRRMTFDEKCFISTIFRGNSLWIIDDDVVSNTETLTFKIGMGTFLDSNAASYIRSLAYEEKPTNDVVSNCITMAKNIDFDEIKNFNPYLYLFENQHNKSEKSIEKVRETISAVIAIEMMNKNLSLGLVWGEEFRSKYSQDAKRKADILLSKFYTDLEIGSISKIDYLTDVMELMLIKTKLIEYGSNRSPENKFEELMSVANSDLSMFMFRELIICADILFRSNKTQLSQKLHSLQNNKDPLSLIRNCAGDLSMVRMMDFLTNSIPDCNGSAFYVANIVTFDKDVMDILKVTEVNAIALHKESHIIHVIFNTEIQNWLTEKLGEKRLQRLAPLQTFNAFDSRYKNRGYSHIKQQLINDRKKLTQLLKK
ncbi:hypothetical protein [Pectobacterium polaris]|uniref:hypothetical protein n=1 Tax=Pectobacterium polaris TaxID=2042057 RepID=UPI000BB3BFDA|nr:hypothetical protein [Pectobacterium polaris]ASY74587.1 hypothetical protein BJJ97_00995 [Pectobacterium polaris]